MTRRLSLLLPLLALAACANANAGAPLPRLLGKSQPAVPEPLPPQVVAALPAGVPPSVVTRNADGCFLITLERTDPPTGFPLTDAAGNRVCETEAVPTDGTAVAGAEVPAPAEFDPYPATASEPS